MKQPAANAPQPAVDGGSEFMAEFEDGYRALRLPLLVLPPRSPAATSVSASRMCPSHFADFSSAHGITRYLLTIHTKPASVLARARWAA